MSLALLMVVALSLGDFGVRVLCGGLAMLGMEGGSEQCHSAGPLADPYSASGGKINSANWKPAPASSSPVAAPTPTLHDLMSGEIDFLMALKLLFLPLLGIVVLLAFLIEEGCATAAAAQQQQQQQLAAAGAANGQAVTGGGAAGGGGLFAWLRSWCLRGPRLTSAYQAQLQANAAALVLAHTQQHAVHAHMAHMALHHGGSGLCCGNCGNANGSTGSPQKKLLATAASSASSSSSSADGSSAASDSHHGSMHGGASPFSSAPLSLRLDGYNHLHGAAGPTLYFNAFQRELPLPSPGVSASSSSSSEVSAVADPKTEEKNKLTSNGKHKKSAAAAPKDAALPDSTSPRSASPAPSPSSSSSSSSFSAASSSLPPASEFIPLTLVNSNTGFRCTLRLWSGLTFAEILKFYVATYWKEERGKYEAIEGGASGGARDEDPEVEVLNALLERSPAPTAAPSPPAASQQGKKKQSAAAVAAAAAAQAAKHAAATAAVSSRTPQPPLMLRYQGIRISPFLTPAAVFPAPPAAAQQVQPTLSAEDAAPASPAASSTAVSSTPPPPVPVLEVCIDYILLFDRARLWSHDLLRKESLRVQGCLEMQHKLIAEVSRTEGEIAALAKKQREGADKHTQAVNDLKRVSKDAERIARELAALVKTRTELEASMASSVGTVSNARARIEAEYRALRAEYDAKVVAHMSSKAEYQSLLDARHESSLLLKQSMIVCESSLRRLNVLKVAKNKREKLLDKIKKMEAALSTPGGGGAANGSATNEHADDAPISPLNAGAVMKSRYDRLEGDHNVLNVHLNELRLQSYEIDEMSKNESYKLRYRLKLLEKDARDLAKWKHVARAHEAEAKESLLWKHQLKQTKAREKQLEQEFREMQQWKMKARAVEKEVRELRQWKARLDANGGVVDHLPSSSFASTGGSSSASALLGVGVVGGSSGSLADFDSSAGLSFMPRHSRTGSLQQQQVDASSSAIAPLHHLADSSSATSDLDSAFAASFAAFQQQQQQHQRDPFSQPHALQHHAHSHPQAPLHGHGSPLSPSFHSSSMAGSGMDADELAELHSAAAAAEEHDQDHHYATAWGNSFGTSSSSGGGGAGGASNVHPGFDVAAAALADDSEAEFAMHNPLAFLAE